MSTQEDKLLLSSQIAAYDEMRNRLETDYFGKWVVFHNMGLINTYDSFEDAAIDAIRKFGRGPYLIRQVGAAPPALPAIVQFGIR